VSVPFELTLSALSVFKTPLAEAFTNYMFMLSEYERDVLAIVLAHERFNVSSPWAAYLCGLPLQRPNASSESHLT